VHVDRDVVALPGQLHASGRQQRALYRARQAPAGSHIHDYDPGCEFQGRTGRGDTCSAAYVGKRLSASPDDAAHFAAVTTLKQEKPGPWRGTLDDAAAVPARIRRS
jgi:hypothetical protein